jgi:hypothetical protein
MYDDAVSPECRVETGDAGDGSLLSLSPTSMGNCIVYCLSTSKHLLLPLTSTTISNDTMGFFSTSGPQPLHPVNPPIGIYPNYLAKQPTVLTLRAHAFSLSGVSCRSRIILERRNIDH